MCIGVDGDQNIFFRSILYPSPVDIQSAGMGIYFYHNTICSAGINDLFMIKRISFTA